MGISNNGSESKNQWGQLPYLGLDVLGGREELFLNGKRLETQEGTEFGFEGEGSISQPFALPCAQGEAVFSTDIGGALSKYQDNQDRFGLKFDNSMGKATFVLVDGMGGSGDGANAASAAVRPLVEMDFNYPEEAIQKALMTVDNKSNGSACFLAGELNGNQLSLAWGGDLQALVLPVEGEYLVTQPHNAAWQIYQTCLDRNMDVDFKEMYFQSRVKNLVAPPFGLGLKAVKKARRNGTYKGEKDCDFEVKQIDNLADRTLVVAASDGLWDVIPPRELAELIRGKTAKEAYHCVYEKINEAWMQNWKSEYADTYMRKFDNITIFIYEHQWVNESFKDSVVEEVIQGVKGNVLADSEWEATTLFSEEDHQRMVGALEAFQEQERLLEAEEKRISNRRRLISAAVAAVLLGIGIGAHKCNSNELKDTGSQRVSHTSRLVKTKNRVVDSVKTNKQLLEEFEKKYGELLDELDSLARTEKLYPYLRALEKGLDLPKNTLFAKDVRARLYKKLIQNGREYVPTADNNIALLRELNKEIQSFKLAKDWQKILGN